jgi:hypothetical protein
MDNSPPKKAQGSPLKRTMLRAAQYTERMAIPSVESLWAWVQLFFSVHTYAMKQFILFFQVALSRTAERLSPQIFNLVGHQTR